jgi:Flp pilus assembly pilin Flp
MNIVNFMRDEEAASSIEYALLLAMVALAIIGVATTLIGPKVAAIFTRTDTEFPVAS